MQERPPFSDWLEKLQQESWNLELLVSGFAIFLLIQAKAALENVFEYFQLLFTFSDEINSSVVALLGVLYLSCYLLIISLIIHIVARGFWIGIIGLRSVQPDVDFQRLKYRSNFEAHLKKKLPSLDRLLIKLDQISSAIFSFAFLIICMLLSLAVWFVITVMIIIFTTEVRVEEEGFIYDAFNVFLSIVIILHLLTSLLYVIDTLWVGVIKRIKWVSKLYHPFYRYMNFITFSFLYRSIYYHLISYIGIWRSRFLFHLIIVPLISLPFTRFDQQIFYPDGNPENETYTSYYDDMRTEDDYINTAAIASSIIKENSLPLFLRYAPDFNTALLKTCAYQPSKKAGFSHGLEISNGGFYLNPPDVEEANSDSLLHCLTDFFQVYINDSLYADQTYVYLTHPNKGERGIYTVLDISTIPLGHSAVRIDGQKWFQNVDSLATYTIASIPFWKE